MINRFFISSLPSCPERYRLRTLGVKVWTGGNGSGGVHAILAQHPLVASYTLDHPQFGGWGATIVYLKKPPIEAPARAG